MQCFGRGASRCLAPLLAAFALTLPTRLSINGQRAPSLVALFDAVASGRDVTLFAVDELEYEELLSNNAWDVGRLLLKLESGVGVLGHVSLAAAADRKRTVEALRAGVGDQWRGVQCFEPRHVIVARRATETMAGVICFECSYLVVLNRTGKTTQGLCDITRVQDEWHQRLVAAGIPVATPGSAWKPCELAKRPASSGRVAEP